MSRPHASPAAPRHAPPRLHPKLLRGMRAGHRLDLLLNAHESWLALAADIQAARTSIDIELYMLEDDPVGEAFVRLLEDACARGVHVRLVLDAVGSMGLPRMWRERLERAGAQVRIYGPLSLSVPWRRWIRRNHRKILTFDDRLSWVMGMNVGCHYFAMDPADLTWADAGVRVEGPLVADLVTVHERGWSRRRRKPLLQQSKSDPQVVPERRDGLAAAALNYGHWRGADANRRYIQAVRFARQRVRLAQSYFLPSVRMERALLAAARGGVDVRVLVPALGASDVPVVSLATHHAVGRLLERGVRVWMLSGRMMHAKFGVVDGLWWTIGSANLDPLSRQYNLEANVAAVGADESARLEAWFEQWCGLAQELDYATWRARPWWLRWLGRIAWLFRAIL